MNNFHKTYLMEYLNSIVTAAGHFPFGINLTVLSFLEKEEMEIFF